MSSEELPLSMLKIDAIAGLMTMQGGGGAIFAKHVDVSMNYWLMKTDKVNVTLNLFIISISSYKSKFVVLQEELKEILIDIPHDENQVEKSDVEKTNVVEDLKVTQTPTSTCS